MNIAFTVLSENFKLVTFNCHGLKSSISYVLDLIKRHDVVFICEHWLKVNELNSISDMCGNDYLCFLKSSIDPYDDLGAVLMEERDFYARRNPMLLTK